MLAGPLLAAGGVAHAQTTYGCSGSTAVGGSSVTSGGLVDDCEALLASEAQLVGMGTALNWDTATAMGGWDGLTVSDTRVTALALRARGLAGTIPAALRDLSSLTRLDLSANQLTGAIPAELGDLSSLVQLWLSDNQLTGAIPVELGDLSSLVFLYLHENQLAGAIPAELGDLSSLTRLWLHQNQLTGEIPAALGDLSSLRQLYLHQNQLTGEIPAALGDLSSLERLWLHENQLTGAIPAELGDLSSLEQLYLRDNQLTGAIPGELGDLSNLTQLFLRNNQLTGCIPRTLEGFASTINPQGSDPDTRRLLLCATAVTLSLAPNAVSEGDAATDITVTTRLNGSLPAETTVRVTQTGGTAASGTDYPAISAFDVTITAGDTIGTATLSFDPTEDNVAEGDETVVLTGAVSGLTSGTATLTINDNDNAGCSGSTAVGGASVTSGGLVDDCEALLVSEARLVGMGTALNWDTATVMRDWDGVTVFVGVGRVSELRLSSRGLAGTIPTALGDLSSLTRLDLFTNQLTGAIPAELGDLSSLTRLDLSDNQLTGAIPAELGDLSNLQALWLEDNSLTGTIPAVLQNLSNLRALYLQNNSLTDSIPAGLGNLSNLAVLYLHNNSLTGAIPAALGDLSNLTILHLYDNGLTGEIPAELGDLSNLVWLHLHGNQLTGEIPAELGDLSSLTQFVARNNQLTGCIPRTLERFASTINPQGESTDTRRLAVCGTVVTLSLAPDAVSEGDAATNITVTAKLNGSLSADTTVSVTRTGGTATSGTDYPAISALTVDIPAGDTLGTATLSFDPTEDILAEGSETVILTGALPGFTSGTDTLTITDNDAAPTAVTLSLSPDEVSEGASATNITVTASLGSTALPADTTVTVTRTGGTATSGTDYTAISAFTVTITAGATSGTAALSFDPTEDIVYEGAETVILTGALSGLTSGTDTLTITDNDAASTAVRLSLNPDAVGEGDAATNITVTASIGGSALPTDTTVSVTRTGGTATSGTDYPPISAFTVAIAAGDTLGTATLSFDPTEDNVYEGAETVILTGALSGLTSGEATLTITDNDAAPTAVTLSLAPNSVNEGDAATNITVTASIGGSALPADTTVSVTRTGGTATSGTDYPAISAFTVEVAAGDTLGTATLSFDPTEDIVYEGAETVILTGALSGLTSGTDTLTINDNDTAPTAVTLSLAPNSVGEGDAATNIIVTASIGGTALPADTTVSVTRTGGTATSGTDYPPISAFTVAIAAGDTLGTATLSFDPTEDNVYEGAETVILTGALSGLTSGTDTLTINDNDTAPTGVTLSLAPNSVGEGAAATNIIVTASIGGTALPADTTVSVTRTGGTATSGTDYPAISAFTVAIAAGDTLGTATLSFDPTEDNVYEGSETVILTGALSGLTSGTDTLTINDNDTAPTGVTLSLAPNSVGEGAAATNIIVTASIGGTALPADTTVSVTRTGGTATSGTDYPAISAFTVAIAAGDTLGTATLSFDPTEDNVYEGAETVILTGALSGLTSGEATLTITDNDDAPTAVTLSLSPDAVGEGDAATNITVTAGLNGSALPADTRVRVTRTGGTATSGTDYPAIRAFHVTIAAGSTSGAATLNFDPTEDIVAEGGETVILTGAVSGLTSGTDTLTITDNDLSFGCSGSTAVGGSSVTSGGLVDDCEALLASEGQLVGTTGTALNWDTATVMSQWDGLTVSGARVTELSLAARGLAGTIPTALGDLSSLGFLDLERNQLTGAIPAELGDLSSLTDLSLYDNQLTGAIPAELGDLSNLALLYLHENQLTGAIPAELGDLSNLTQLFLRNNQLTGCIPETLEGFASTINPQGDNSNSRQLLVCATAVILSLAPNAVSEGDAATNITVTARLNGSLPADTTVRVTRTGGTATSGTDYPAISAFTVTITAGATSGTATLSFDPTEDNVYEGDETVILTGALSGFTSGTATLTIHDNDTGSFGCSGSTAVGGSSVTSGGLVDDCEALLASEGQLVGTGTALNWDTATVMSQWDGLIVFGARVRALDLTSSDLAGTIPTALGSLSSLTDLWLDDNQLTGAIPAALGNLSSLIDLYLNDNQLMGAIPTELGDLSSLRGLFLNDNQLTGAIPAKLGDLSSLEQLWLHDNQLTGAIPAKLGDLSSLIELYLHDNQLTGAIPAELGDLSSLIDLYLYDNQLTGAIPVELGDLSSLERLDLSDNKLTGAIPAELGDLSSLIELHLYDNQLTGAIPAELGDLSSLTNLRLNDNKLTGAIPAKLGDLSSLERLDLYDNQLTGTIPAELGDLSSLRILDLSENQLTGAIPAELGDLSSLHQFYLNDNQLTSEIPAELGDLSSLRILDLSENQLTGTIPAELGDLSRLIGLWLRYNQLTGCIPGTLERFRSTINPQGDNSNPRQLLGCATAVTLSLAPGTVSEGAAATDITVTAKLNGSLSADTTVSVTRTGGTATSGTDYPAISAFTVAIAAGSTSGTATLSFDPREDNVYEGDETVILTGALSGLTSGTDTLTITDNDTAPTALTLSLAPNSVNEGDAATNIAVTASIGGTALPSDTTVRVTRTGGTATSGTDYPPISAFTVAIAAGDTLGTAMLSFDPTEDIVYEGDETVILTGALSGLTSGTDTLTITDNDTAPTAVTLSLSPDEVSEGAAATNITVTASLGSTALPSDTTVRVTRTGGTATSGTDYPPISAFTVDIPAGDTLGTAMLSFDPTEDIVHEGSETVILTGALSGLTSGTDTLTINDNDAAPTAVTLSLNPDAVSEGASATNITVTASLGSTALPADTAVTVTRTGGTATSGTDYPAISAFTVAIAAGDTLGTATLSFDPTEDIVHEGSETVILTGALSGLTSGTDTLTITDNDAASTAVRLSLNPDAVGEGDAATNITVTASIGGSALPTDTTVSVTRTGGTATSGTDYPPISAFTVDIPAGDTLGTATLSFDPTEDIVHEGSETVILTGALSGLTSGEATLTITDNDAAPTAVTLSLAPNSVNEGDAATNITVTASIGGSALPTDTTVSVTRTGGTATSGTDYPAISAFTVEVAAGDTLGTATLSFDPTEDIVYEGAETVILTGALSGLTSGTDTLTITDNDAAPTAVTLSLSPDEVSEGASATNITVTASIGSTALPADTAVTVTRTGGTATSGTDYPAISAFTVAIAAGDTLGTATLSFDPTEDIVHEGSETVILTGALSGLTSGTDTLTITDNDAASTAVRLSLNPAAVGEGASATNITVTASIGGTALPADTTVRVTRTGGTAASGTDYPAISAFTVEIAAGDTLGTAMLNFDPTEDIVYEGDETVILTGALSGLTSGEATLTINDNDTRPTAVRLSLAPNSVNEGDAATNIAVTASIGGSALPTDTTVSVTRTGGTATSGTDYPPISAFTVEIAAGDTLGTAMLSFDPTEDIVYEGAETVILTGALSGLTSGEATLTINDNDTASTALRLSLNPDAVGEGAGATNITVTASIGGSALPADTTVSVTRTGGTATSGTDYPAISAFTIVITAGSTSGTATLSFDPTEDIVYEGDETVILTAAATGLQSGTATLTITDNDTPGPIVTINPLSPQVAEDAGEVWLTVSLNRPAESALSVGWHTVSQTAHTPEDYIGRHNQTVMFGVGEDRKTISLVIVDDEVHEGLVNGLHESFLVSMKAGSGYRFLPMGESSFSLVRIVDNDPPDVTPPSLVEAAVEGDELFLEYDELLDRASVPARGDFVVTADGDTIDVSRVVIRSGSVASTVTLDLADPVQAGQSVRLDYTPGSNPIRDEAGNNAAALSGEPVFNDTGTDTRPPRLTGATVNGATLVLAYDEALDDRSSPARGDFAVTAGGSGIGVSRVDVGGSSVTLTLARAVAANQTVTLDYTSGTNPIRDEAGNEAAALSGENVTNNTAGDTQAPRLTGATVNGATLVLAYDEPLDGASRPATGDFAVTTGGSGIGVSRVDVGGSSVTLTLASAVAANQAVTLDYTPGTNPIRDEAGNEAAALSGRSVTNNTGGDTRAPQLTGATVNGATLVLAYDEALDGASRPATDDFSVTAGGSGHGVSRVDVGGSSVTLTLLRAVAANQAVTLDYTPGANPIRDEAGNEAAALSGRSVTNNTPGDTRAPRLTGATVNAATLVLAYDEPLDGASRPATGDFSVTADGYGKEVSRVDVGGSSVTLTLAGWVEANQVVKLRYTPSENPIQDEAGNDAAPLSGQSVTNNTPADPGGKPRVSINPDWLSVDEDVGNARLTVSLDRRASVPVSVAWYTQDNSAEAPGDYAARDEAVTFAAGEDRKTISVPIVNDTIREDPVHGNHESFFVIIRKGPGYVRSDSSNSLVVIVDDDGASGDSAGTAQDALALLDGLTPDEASAALLGAGSLTEAQLDALDRLGNRNGRYDLGDLLSWTERCRKGEAGCGGASEHSGPAGAAVLLLAPAVRGRRRMRSRLLRAGAARLRLVPWLLAAAAAASCTGDLVGPPGREAAAALPALALPGPGFLAVEWTTPEGRRDAGALLELDGPGIDSVQAAPGLETYHYRVPGRLRVIVAGPLPNGPLLRFRVPDRSALPSYRVRVLEVTDEDYRLRDPTECRAAIAPN